MEKNNMNALLMDKIADLSELEIKKSKVMMVIFEKSIQEIISKKVQALKSNFEEQANFYAQNLKDYEHEYNEILQKYKEQLIQVTDKYNELFINMYLELQEAECNQKISITNMKKTHEIKQEIENKAEIEIIESYNKKIGACLQKKNNYDIIIKRCEHEIEKCSSIMENKINLLFSDKSSQMSVKEENVFGKFIHKIKNMFNGKAKFNTYVVEPINIELEIMDSKLPDITENITQEIVLFVAKMKQAKDEVNKLFEKMV